MPYLKRNSKITGELNINQGGTVLKKNSKIILFALIITGLFGCAQNISEKRIYGSQLDRNWGRSFEAAKYNQTLNPEAGNHSAPVEGLEGPVGEKIMEQLIEVKDQKNKPPSEFGVVTIKQ
jgi:hypothetical protein